MSFGTGLTIASGCAMTERDREVLCELEAACRQLAQYRTDVWVQPLDCGGGNGSDHTYRLSKLTRMGFAESRQRSASGQRGSKNYRITESGRKALQ